MACFCLFRTSIRTIRVRESSVTSLILKEFSCGKVQIPYRCKQQMKIEVFMLRTVVFYTTSGKDSLSLLVAVRLNTTSMGKQHVRW